MALIPLLVCASVTSVRAQDARSSGRVSDARETLRQAYVLIESAEDSGLELLKAGDLEFRISAGDTVSEWEDGMLWRAGFAPAIEGERNEAPPLPVSEELVMSMLGWSLGAPGWNRRFGNAVCETIGRAGTPADPTAGGSLRVRVRYEDGRREPQVFTIEGGRIIDATDGMYRTTFHYTNAGTKLRITKVTRTAIAAIPSMPNHIAVTFDSFREVGGANIATRARLDAATPMGKVSIESEMSKLRGNRSVSKDDVDASYSRWGARLTKNALRRAYAPTQRGLTSFDIKTLEIDYTATEGGPARVRCSARWSLRGIVLEPEAPELPADVRTALVESMRCFLLGGTPSTSDARPAITLAPTTDPHRRSRVMLAGDHGRPSSLLTISGGPIVGVDEGNQTTRLRHTHGATGALVSRIQRSGGRIGFTSTLSEFKEQGGFWLPTRLTATVDSGAGKTSVTVQMSGLTANTD